MQAELVSLARCRPPRPNFIEDPPIPRKRFLSPVRRRIKQLMFTTIDKGWFGLQPLRSHIVICGFPRRIDVAAVAGGDMRVRRPDLCYQASALGATRYALRNHPFMITKDPNDVFFLDEIRAFYATHQADVRFILTVRDPRAVLTSVHGISTDQPADYYIPTARWPAYYAHVRYAQQFDGVLTLEYRNLICHPAEVQRRLTEFIGWHVHMPFDQFHTAASPDFRDFGALNGLRPLDPTRLDSWRQEKHRDRIRQILQEIPEMPEYLIEMGYESDSRWVRDYL